MADVPAPVDPAEETFLSGVFAPTVDEHDDRDLKVEGELPAGLAGAYLRNGPNPMFPPLGSYSYPLDGDGMVHGLWFEEGTVRYRNRFVWTPQLKAEQAAGHALWAGIMTPYFPGPDVVPADLANAFKAMPDINVVRHGGRLWALGEGDPPIELTADLETGSKVDFGGAIPGICAHPKVDPATGELLAFRYDIEEPYLTWSIVAADGSVGTAPQTIELDTPCMIHDFAITESSIVLFVGPLIFDLDAMLTGGSLLAWKPEVGMRIAVIGRRDRSVRWIHTDAFWVWHFANAFDRARPDGSTEIVVDGTQWSRPPGIIPGGGAIEGSIVRFVLDPAAGTFSRQVWSDEGAEFSRIDDRCVGQQHRAFVVTNRTAGMPVDEQNVIVRVDTQTGALTRWESGDWVFDEVCFVPDPGGAPEEGCYITFRTNRETLESDAVLIAADELAAGPVARIALPHRVPAGLHGNWMPADG